MSFTPRAKAIALLTGIACLSGSPKASSDQQKPDRPVFKSAVDIAVIDVTVVDDDGKPVRGLTADDFVVKVAGQRRRIQALDFLEFGVQRQAAVSPSAPAPSNNLTTSPAAGTNRGGRIIVVVVDDLSSKPVANAGLLAAAERILATLDPADLVGLVTTSGYGPVVAPTTNRDEFRSALRNKTLAGRYDSLSSPFYITTKEAMDADNRTRGQAGWLMRECPPSADTDPNCAERATSAARRLGAEARHRRDQQLVAYANIIEGLKSTPRPRVLIVLGQGLALDGYSGRREEIDRLGRLAADADVRFYSLTDTDDGPGASIQGSAIKCEPPACIDYRRAQRNEESFLLGGMQILAAATGGEAFRSIGQADRLLNRVLVETSGVYRLGVEVPGGAAEKYPDLKVTIARRGLTVRATRHLAPEREESSSLPIDEVLRQRIAVGGHAFGVPLTVAALVRGDPTSERQDVGISIRVPADVPAPLSLRFALVDDQGRIVGGGDKRDIAPRTTGDDNEVTLLTGVKASAQGYRLRVAVADANGRVGSVERRVMNAMVSVGPLRLSQVFLNWSTTDGRNYLAFDVAPHSATELSCTMDVYPGAAAPADPSVRFFFYRDGSPTTVLEREVALAPSASAMVATVSISMSELSPGSYSMTATVMDAGRPLGSQSASFTVVRR
jgi:VWFA-related protein